MPLYKLFSIVQFMRCGIKSIPQSQHNEGVGGCNEGKPKDAI